VVESWRADRGVRGVFPVLAGRGEKCSNWDSRRRQRIGTAGEADELGEGGVDQLGRREKWDAVPYRTVLYYPGLVCFVRRDKDQQGRVGRAGLLVRAAQ
jgi:hypothetical protein